MKKNAFLSILLTCLTIVILTSCSKKNDDTPIVIPDKVDLLTATSWIEQNLAFSEAGHDKTAIYNGIYGDLSVNFNADGTYSVTSEKLSLLTSGTWTINESQTVLTATDTNNSYVFNLTIVSLSSTSLGLQFTYTYFNGSINVAVFIEGTFVPA